MQNVKDASVYTDFNSLAKLKNEAKGKTPEAIKEVAKQFESIFVGMMLKSMRQASLAEGILDSSQSDFYRDMYDQQLSVELAGEGGLGLADVIAKQLSPDQSVSVTKEQSIADYSRKVLIEIPTNQNSLDKVIDQSGELFETNDKGFSSPEDFIHQLRPYAQQAAKKLGVDTNVLLSQAALETGWGKSIIKSGDGQSSHNLFNIKADKSWHGQQTHVSTLEFKDGIGKKEMSGFRSYSSYQESFNDYVDFIQNNPRYKDAIKMAEKPEQYMHELQQAGYATDPDYASKVMKIVQSKQMTHVTPDLLALKQRSIR
ncbi:MAG: flagellar assembly peptidoglycan hydrolase FlgJ [Methylococcales bacterium]|nr:flagellar assembly peptidoglycan hydrolase FlgJ [Methylococcales bacterium]